MPARRICHRPDPASYYSRLLAYGSVPISSVRATDRVVVMPFPWHRTVPAGFEASRRILGPSCALEAQEPKAWDGDGLWI